MQHNLITINMNIRVVGGDFNQYEFEKRVIDLIQGEFACQVDTIDLASCKESLTHPKEVT